MQWCTTLQLRKKCPYSDFFWSVFSHIETEYEYLLSKSPSSVRMRKNTDQKKSEYEHFYESDYFPTGIHFCVQVILLNLIEHTDKDRVSLQFKEHSSFSKTHLCSSSRY